MPVYKKQVSDTTYGAGWNGVTHLAPSQNAVYDKIETLSSGGGETVSKSISQTTHGFAVGDVLKYASSTYAKAQADSAANAEVVGIVSAVADANTFTLLTNGYISTLSGLTANTTYFLSASSAGALTSTEPSTAGQVSKPVLRAVSTTAGYFTNMRGLVIPGTSSSAITLLKAGTGSSTNASAENVDTIAISGLTSLDTLVIYFDVEGATQTTASVRLYNNTDAVDMGGMLTGTLAAGTQQAGMVTVRQSPQTSTLIRTVTSGADRESTNNLLANSTFTTAWTGSWTLALRQGGVTAGGTFYWKWAVYKLAGQ